MKPTKGKSKENLEDKIYHDNMGKILNNLTKEILRGHKKIETANKFSVVILGLLLFNILWELI